MSQPYYRGRNKLLYCVDDDGRPLGVKDMARDCGLDLKQAEAALKELEEKGLLIRKGRRIYLTQKGETNALLGIDLNGGVR